MNNGRKIPLQEMAIDALTYIDGERDYFEWKHRKIHGLKGGLDMKQAVLSSLMSFIVAFIVSFP